jgi:mono/diheme cytochrome c family protein
MNYPFWDLPVAYGVLMASVAVLHVFISHFAIGGGLYLVVTEQIARKRGDTERLEFLERLSRLFVLVTLVAGALTGVWIWFVIGLLSPAAVEVLIHHYVWGWATEWTFFIVEITSAILYYYGWKRMPARDHMIIGWIYFAAAWLSLVVINGILSFMLTPGKWLMTGQFWDGFFNPTYWSSLTLRTGICAMLAGLYALAVASRCPPGDFKSSLVRYSSLWALIGLAASLSLFSWYWQTIPASVTSAVLQIMPWPVKAWSHSYRAAAVLAGLLIVFGLLLPKRYGRTVATLAMIAALAWFAGFEIFREAIRKPYIIYGYMYGNGFEVARTADYRKNGYLANIAYRTGDDGADLFRHACRSCHTISGYKSLKPAFDGTDKAFIAGTVRSAHLLKGNMPPFMGTPYEADAIAGWIYSRIDHRPMSRIYGLQGIALGRQVFEVRCGRCHAMGGPHDKTQTLAELTDTEYENMLNAASDLGEGMTAFTGDAEERSALIAYLKTLKAGGMK